MDDKERVDGGDGSRSSQGGEGGWGPDLISLMLSTAERGRSIERSK